jgi:hypothetical protein
MATKKKDTPDVPDTPAAGGSTDVPEGTVRNPLTNELEPIEPWTPANAEPIPE